MSCPEGLQSYSRSLVLHGGVSALFSACLLLLLLSPACERLDLCQLLTVFDMACHGRCMASAHTGDGGGGDKKNLPQTMTHVDLLRGVT